MSSIAASRILAPSSRGPHQGRYESVPLSSPDITEEDRNRVNAVLCGRTLSLGPLVPAFEAALAEASGTQFAVAVNSGTSALHLCVKAEDIGAGDEVITTPFSFVASANCLLYERAVPRFVDIDIDTYNLNTKLIPQAINRNTRGIIPVHVFGNPCDMLVINEIAERNGLSVIEDACEALGSSVGGHRAGSFGQSAAFAFYPNKQITTGEGGAIVTNHERIARFCRSWRNQGRSESSAWLQHERLGYNYRLSDINCALGLGQVARLASILAMRRKVAETYDQLLGSVSTIVLPPRPLDAADMSWFVYVIRLQDDFSREDRDDVLDILRSRGIGCNNYFSPIHLQTFYRERFGHRRGDFPVTEHVADRTIALPFFNRLTMEQIDNVCHALVDALDSVRPAMVPGLAETRTAKPVKHGC